MRRRISRWATRLVPALLAMAVVTPGAFAQWSNDPVHNNPLCNFFFMQNGGPAWLGSVSDGQRGAYYTWADLRGTGSTNRVFATYVVPPGVFGQSWPPQAIQVCTAASVQTEPALMFDGRALYVAWTDLRGGATEVYLQRMLPNGSIAPGWPADGVQLSLVAGTDHTPQLVSDGNGGVLVVWTHEALPTDYDIYGAHVDSLTNLSYAPIVAVPGIQTSPSLTGWYFGPAVMAYQDNSAGNWNIRMVGFNPNLTVAWGPIDVCNASGDQTAVRLVADGEYGVGFGLLAAWNDLRAPLPNVFAARFRGSFTTPPLSGGWAVNGNAIGTAGIACVLTSLASDFANGVLIGWEQGSGAMVTAFAQRMLITGTPAPGWPLAGRAMSSGSEGREIRVVTDGNAGAFCLWRDNRAGDFDIYAQRLDPSSNVAVGWPVNALPVGLAALMQYEPVAVPDGSGRLLAVWRDKRFGAGSSDGPVAQLVDHFGALGNAEPAIVSVKDVGADQGGNVKIKWNASYLDTDQFGNKASSYWIWREVPVALAAAAVSAGAAWLEEGAVVETPPTGRMFMTTTLNAVQSSWEFLASQPASGFPTYSYVASTTQDSMPGSNPKTAFMVQARGSGGAYWNSLPDSGYSVDNLPPGMPAPLTGEYAAGATHLHWNPNLEGDFAEYRIYRGPTAGFIPGPLNQVGAQPDTGFAESPASPFYYKVSAVDSHGNESPFALFTPSLLSVDDHADARVFWLGRPEPNPMRGVSVVRFTLPHAMNVSLGVFDVLGRRVAWITRGMMSPGEHVLRWAGRDDSGGVLPNGIYLISLNADEKTLNQRVAVLR